MTRKSQQNEQEELRAPRPITIRPLGTLAAVAALAVTTLAVSAPVASASAAKKPASQTHEQRGFIDIGTTETLDMNARVMEKARATGKVANRTKSAAAGIVTNNYDPDSVGR